LAKAQALVLASKAKAKAWAFEDKTKAIKKLASKRLEAKVCPQRLHHW